MIIVKPQVLVPADAFDGHIAQKLERYARVCYKSEQQMNPGGDPDFLRRIVKSGHESIVEHEKVTVMFVIDRGVSHEIVRHRVGAAYSQESTRYCRYSHSKFGSEITVIEPFFFAEDESANRLWSESCAVAEKNYMALLELGRSAQEARSILPNSLKTEIVVTYNLREWRHFFRLRCDKAAHPQMRQVAIPLLLHFKTHLPVLFDDVPYDKEFPASHYAAMITTDDLFQPLIPE
ncbi:MAG TPA: FAD-dependent thymidylate synthase [Syntrophomonas sp.]|nr:FAD-dependent thymidylate synthase [Syntrophomonas sp.]